LKNVLTPIAKDLRSNPTEAEKHLWYQLRLKNLGVKFRRQTVVGQYIVDFVCFEKKLVIEIDGGQHAENLTDEKRDQWLVSQGFKILRFWNHEVFENRESVVQNIMDHLTPIPNPPHKKQTGSNGGG
jgi:very-short-patch-repair endonuclease